MTGSGASIISRWCSMSSTTVLNETSFSCWPCSTRGATSEGVVLMSGPEGVLATIRVLATIVRSGELGAVGDRLSTGCRGGSFRERLKDRCTEGGGCGGDGTWARKKGAHCGSQPTPPTEERNTKPLGCRCGKVCPMALLVSPFERCQHTLRVSLSVGTAWSCGRPGIMCSACRGGGYASCGGAMVCTGAEMQR